MPLTKIDDRGLTTPIDLIDNEKIRLGTGNDLELFHDGSASNIKDTGTGHINLWSNEVRMIDAGGSEYMFRAFENGAVELYHNNGKKFETTANGAEITGQLDITGGFVSLDDNYSVVMGTGGDAQLYHSGTHQYLLNTTGNIYVMPKSGEYSIACYPDGAVELYNDNSKKLNTRGAGIDITGDLRFDTSVTGGIVRLADDQKVFCGSGDDLQIYHDGSNNHIVSAGTGTLRISDGDNSTAFETVSTHGNNVYQNFRHNTHGNTFIGAETDSFVIYTKDSGASSHSTRININHSGLAFHSDTADANRINDYEEGSWTPVIKKYVNSTWVNATMTDNGTIQQSHYTKIGNTVQIYLFWDGWQHSDANYCVVGGLPFTSNGGGIIIPAYNNAFTAMQNQGGLIGHTTNNISFYYDGTNWNAWNSGSARTLYLGGFYFTT